jgi:hypothetical protein
MEVHLVLYAYSGIYAVLLHLVGSKSAMYAKPFDREPMHGESAHVFSLQTDIKFIVAEFSPSNGFQLPFVAWTPKSRKIS